MVTKRRRATVSAASEALETLEAEAQRRGVSLGSVLREAVEEKAVSLRAARRPRTGVASSSDGRSAAEVTERSSMERDRRGKVVLQIAEE